MSEIKREPVRATINGKEVAAFDEDHTLADVARWAMENPVDGEELHRILGDMIGQEDASR